MLNKVIKFNDVKTISKGCSEDYINLYESVDHEYYGTYYWNKGNNSKDVKCINKKWYDYDENYIRDWNEQDDEQVLEALPF